MSFRGLATERTPEPAVGAAGALVAWRAWTLARSADGSLALRPVFRDGECWPPATPARARCQDSTDRRHAAPHPGCGCGLYAVADPGFLPVKGLSVIGAVSLWGDVVEHRRGFRAEFGYPYSLRLVCSRCGRMRALERMVVREDAEEAGELVAACSRHLRGRSGPATPAREVQLELMSAYGVDLLPREAGRARCGWRGFILRLVGIPTGLKALLLACVFMSVLVLQLLAAVLGEIRGGIS